MISALVLLPIFIAVATDVTLETAQTFTALQHFGLIGANSGIYGIFHFDSMTLHDEYENPYNSEEDPPADIHCLRIGRLAIIYAERALDLSMYEAGQRFFQTTTAFDTNCLPTDGDKWRQIWVQDSGRSATSASPGIAIMYESGIYKVLSSDLQLFTLNCAGGFNSHYTMHYIEEEAPNGKKNSTSVTWWEAGIELDQESGARLEICKMRAYKWRSFASAQRVNNQRFIDILPELPTRNDTNTTSKLEWEMYCHLAELYSSNTNETYQPNGKIRYAPTRNDMSWEKENRRIAKDNAMHFGYHNKYYGERSTPIQSTPFKTKKMYEDVTQPMTVAPLDANNVFTAVKVFEDGFILGSDSYEPITYFGNTNHSTTWDQPCAASVYPTEKFRLLRLHNFVFSIMDGFTCGGAMTNGNKKVVATSAIPNDYLPAASPTFLNHVVYHQNGGWAQFPATARWYGGILSLETGLDGGLDFTGGHNFATDAWCMAWVVADGRTSGLYNSSKAPSKPLTNAQLEVEQYWTGFDKFEAGLKILTSGNDLLYKIDSQMTWETSWYEPYTNNVNVNVDFGLTLINEYVFVLIGPTFGYLNNVNGKFITVTAIPQQFRPRYQQKWRNCWVYYAVGGWTQTKATGYTNTAGIYTLQLGNTDDFVVGNNVGWDAIWFYYHIWN